MDTKPKEWKDLGASTAPTASAVDWSRRSKLNRCDPYLVWNDLISDARVDAKKSTELVTVIIERKLVDGKVQSLPQTLQGFLVPTHWHDFKSDAKNRVRSYVLLWSGVKNLVEAVENDRIARFELSRPRLEVFDLYLKRAISIWDNKDSDGLISIFEALGIPKSLLTTFFDLQTKGIQPNALSMDQLGLQEFSPSHQSKPISKSDKLSLQTFVAVIDDLCPFASPRFQLADGTSAVKYLWDQGLDKKELERRRQLGADLHGLYKRPRPSSPDQARQLNGELSWDPGHEIEFPSTPPGARATHVDLRQEAETYKRVGYLTSLRSWGHGTVVTHLIAAAAGGKHAPPMIWVQLPDTTVGDTSGGSLAAHALDGILHALDRAAGRKLVVNLSYGTHAGPHDGTSLFEVGLQSLLNCYPNLHVVLPAGNSHLLKTHSGAFVPGKCSTSLRWMVLPDDPTNSYLEIWFPSPGAFKVKLTPPQGDSVTVCAGLGKVWRMNDGTIRAAVIFPDAVAQGRNGTMCLVALSPTRRSVYSKLRRDNSRSPPLEAPHGVWKVELTNETSEAVSFDAWIQRDDSAPGRGPRSRGQMGRQSYFLDGCEDHVDPRSTLNGIATLAPHDRLRVVGAMRASDSGVSLYSAAGPNRGVTTRCTGPDLVALADHSLNLPGLLAAGTLASSRIRVGGTSIAAAVVSGMLYRHLSEGHTADSFCFFPVLSPSRQPRPTASSPERAEDYLRGSGDRMEISDTDLDSVVHGAASHGLSAKGRRS